MALIERFEDIIAWQEARKLVGGIYKLTNSGSLAKDYGLKDQLQRAAVSAMTNIAEGFDCDSQVEFARFLSIARRSAVEVQSLLYAALDFGYIDQQTFDAEYDLSLEFILIRPERQNTWLIWREKPKTCTRLSRIRRIYTDFS